MGLAACCAVLLLPCEMCVRISGCVSQRNQRVGFYCPCLDTRVTVQLYAQGDNDVKHGHYPPPPTHATATARPPFTYAVRLTRWAQQLNATGREFLIENCNNGGYVPYKPPKPFDSGLRADTYTPDGSTADVNCAVTFWVRLVAMLFHPQICCAFRANCSGTVGCDAGCNCRGTVGCDAGCCLNRANSQQVCTQARSTCSGRG